MKKRNAIRHRRRHLSPISPEKQRLHTALLMGAAGAVMSAIINRHGPRIMPRLFKPAGYPTNDERTLTRMPRKKNQTRTPATPAVNALPNGEPIAVALSEAEQTEIANAAAKLWLTIGETTPGPDVYRVIHTAIKDAYVNGKAVNNNVL